MDPEQQDNNSNDTVRPIDTVTAPSRPSPESSPSDVTNNLDMEQTEPSLAEVAKATSEQEPDFSAAPNSDQPPAPIIAPEHANETVFSIAAAKPKAPNKLPLIIIIVLACLAVLTAVGFFFFRPVDKDTLVTEAVNKAFDAELVNLSGDFNFQSDDSHRVSLNITAELDSRGNATAGFVVKVLQTPITVSLTGEIIAIADDVYVKLDGINETISLLSPAFELGEQGTIMNELSALANKIDGQWIHITSDDLEGLDLAENSCQIDSVALRTQLKDLYSNNNFMVVGDELSEQDGSRGFALSVDQAKAKDFMGNLEKLPAVEALGECFSISMNDATMELDEDEAVDELAAEIWVDKSSRELTALTVKTRQLANSSTLTLSAKDRGSVAISAPTDYAPLSDILADIQSLMLSLMFSGSSYNAIDSDLNYLEPIYDVNGLNVEDFLCDGDGC